MSRRESTEETRAHILEVARREFVAKGYAGTSINAIVDVMRVSKPTVYYHFKNKASLFATLVEDAFDRFIGNRTAAVDEWAPADEQIVQAISADFAFCLESPDLVQFTLALVFAFPEEQPVDLRAALDRDHDSYRALIERGITRGELRRVNARDAAMMLQGSITLNIMSFLKMGHPPDFLSPERARLLAGLFLDGMRSEGEKRVRQARPKRKKESQ